MTNYERELLSKLIIKIDKEIKNGCFSIVADRTISSSRKTALSCAYFDSIIGNCIEMLLNIPSGLELAEKKRLVLRVVDIAFKHPRMVNLNNIEKKGD